MLLYPALMDQRVYSGRCGYEGGTVLAIQQVFCEQRGLIVVPWGANS